MSVVRRRPSLLQRVLAGRAFYLLIPVLAAIYAEFLSIAACDVTSLGLHDWKYFILFAAVILTSGPFGFMVGILVSRLPYCLVANFAVRLNGGPFKVGDRVQIIAGKFAGTATTITGNWQHGSVRVDLGDAARKDLSDIYGQYELMREPE